MSELINEGEFTTAIEIIADKLGIAVAEIFRIFVEAQTTLGMMTILESIGAILLCLASYFISMKVISGRYTYEAAIRKGEEENDYVDADGKAVYIILPLFVAVVVLLMGDMALDHIGNGILRILCPEYTAITDIINIVRP